MYTPMPSSVFTLSNALRLTILVGIAGVFSMLVQSCQQPASKLDSFSVGSLKKLAIPENPRLLPTVVLNSLDGQELAMSSLQGKIVLVNLWGTWCPPCIKEMPSLDRLQGLRGSDDFQVITISIESLNEPPAKFFVDNQIKNLVPWHDSSYRIPGILQLRGYPTTILYNRQGVEVASLEGDAEWDSEEALALFDYLISQ